MPEGPSIVIFKEDLKRFSKAKVLHASGTSKLDYSRIAGKKILEFRTWGKHLLIVFDGFALRIHFLMFGTYRVDERKELKPRLSLKLNKGHEINFYTTAIRWIEGSVEDVYDWSSDVMSPLWNRRKVRKKLNASCDLLACDALMDQNLFSGVGNIIKNEVLFRIRLHPENRIDNIPAAKLTALIKEARNYSFEFFEWRKKYALKKHLLIYGKKLCPRCRIPIARELTGKSKRTTFFCTNCQLVYPL